MLCLNNGIDDFQEQFRCMKVSLTAEGELAAGMTFPGPSCLSAWPMAAVSLLGLQQLELEPLPAAFRHCPGEGSSVDPRAEDRRRRKCAAGCRLHLRLWGEACPCLSFCSLPTGCRWRLLAMGKLPGLSEPQFLYLFSGAKSFWTNLCSCHDCEQSSCY